MEWPGACNELNAAYAVDRYSHTRGLLGVLVTTYGVGELSAINGISGAYSEQVPIIHIIGTISTPIGTIQLSSRCLLPFALPRHS
jgi:pyruvate decarboxylase